MQATTADFGAGLEGRSLQATNRDWSCGAGLALRGMAADLARVLGGRTVPQGSVEGEPR